MVGAEGGVEEAAAAGTTAGGGAVLRGRMGEPGAKRDTEGCARNGAGSREDLQGVTHSTEQGTMRKEEEEEGEENKVTAECGDQGEWGVLWVRVRAVEAVQTVHDRCQSSIDSGQSESKFREFVQVGRQRRRL
jgi:hypothetical protein